MRMPIILLACLAVLSGYLMATPEVKLTDPKDRQVVDAFLGHVRNVPKYVSAEACKKMAARECEGITWRLLPYTDMPLTAYELTGDTKYLDIFVTAMGNLCGAMTRSPDGYMGWYGKALGGFQNPDDPDKKVDVIINSFRAVEQLGRFMELTSTEAKLRKKYAEQRKMYADLAANHLIKKWTARGNYVDMGKDGAIYRTHRGLKESKAHLTQPHNKHSIIIRGLLSLYRATDNDEHMRMAIKLGVRYKRSLILKGGHYEWHYWDPAGKWDILPSNPSKWKHWIGVEHKGGYYSSSLTQAVVLYQHGLVFDKTDMKRFVKTQEKMAWNGDMDNPKWARCDGTTSKKYMKGSYMCGALAPLSDKISQFVYTGGRLDARLRGAKHGWQGGPVANGWIAGKFVTLPKARGAKQFHVASREKFLKNKANRDFLASMEFSVSGSGYKTPTKPADMKPMPR